MNRQYVSCFAVFLVLTVIAPLALGQTFGIKKKRPKFHEFGNVVMDNYREKNGIAPVVFQHWVHRARYTCRLCHIDLGFAMKANETQVTEDDNKMGMYCGSCHNGTIAFAPEEGDGSVKRQNCDRCHSVGKDVEFRNDFLTFRKGLPRDRFGNGIDWIAAEEQGKIQLIDYIAGMSINRKKINDPEDLDLSAKEPNMPDIVFSHKKHAIWSGCESCHPEIFPVKRGAQPYSMQHIFDGMYCGVCHDKVAFPNIDCRKCHTKDVYTSKKS